MATTTERQGAGPARPRLTPPRMQTTAGAALAAFLGAFALLAWQMGEGRDPVLGHGFAAAAAPPREVVVRRVVITRVQPERVVVMRKVLRAAAAAPPPEPVVVRTVAPVRQAPAVHVSAPAPAAAPKAAAPAKAPTPPTTHQS